MRISTRGRYALRFMIDLAQHGGEEYITLKDVSKRQGISVKYLEQITSLLSKLGLLLSVRGPSGGYKLARKPENYTAGEILRVTEGDMAPVACLAEPENSCPRKDNCPTLPFWKGLNDVIKSYLDSTSLKDLAVATPQTLQELEGIGEESAPCNQ
ncbi:MAG: Rrf2 family transcriptional regulator [Treponema sp.]|nr:Rrf2 family transcriptional regulator [Treponema sp.]